MPCGGAAGAGAADSDCPPGVAVPSRSVCWSVTVPPLFPLFRVPPLLPRTVPEWYCSVLESTTEPARLAA